MNNKEENMYFTINEKEIDRYIIENNYNKICECSLYFCKLGFYHDIINKMYLQKFSCIFCPWIKTN